MNFVIVHFNTPELTTCLCSSLRKHHPTDEIVIFDNSDKRPFTNIDLFNLTYINNTENQIINFDKKFSHYQIDSKVYNINKCGSAKHTLTIDWLIKNINDNFCLLDSDILIKKKIDFCDTSYLTCGELNTKELKAYKNRKPRILPFIQFFNVNLIKKFKINYFDYTRIMGFDINARDYDTGASFYEDVLNKKINCNIKLDDYMIHYKGGSWAKNDFHIWLMKNKSLWQYR